MNTHSVYCFQNMEHYSSAIINYPPYLFLCKFSYQWLRISSDFNIFLKSNHKLIKVAVSLGFLLLSTSTLIYIHVYLFDSVLKF